MVMADMKEAMREKATGSTGMLLSAIMYSCGAKAVLNQADSVTGHVHNLNSYRTFLEEYLLKAIKTILHISTLPPTLTHTHTHNI